MSEEAMHEIPSGQSTKLTARETVLAFVRRMSLGERGERLWSELLWVLLDKQKQEVHPRILPDYCYNIFEKLRLTLFRSFPSLAETVTCTDQAGLAKVKTHSEAKEFVKLDWYRFGKVFSLPLRFARFLDLEMDGLLEVEGLSNLESQDEKFIEQMLGEKWLKEKGVDLGHGEFDKTLQKLLRRENVEQLCRQREAWNQVAYEWGPVEMSEFNRGLGDGLNEFMDENGELVGQTGRTWNYITFLLLWPEIKELLEQEPMQNRTEVFEWLTPFREAHLVCIPSIDEFRDFCEDIGLKFAGRLHKKSL